MSGARVTVFDTWGEPLTVREVPLPEPKPGEVLVRMLAAGICGTDAHVWRGRDPRVPLPMTLGHEGVGQVVAVGISKHTVDGESIQPGDVVIWNRGVVCGRCYWCTVAGTPTLCPHRWAYGISRSFDYGTHLNGCYADHLLLDASADILFGPPGVPPEVLVAASCSGSTAAHAFDQVECRTGDTVLVQGAGPVGSFAVALARAHGAGQIIVIDAMDERLEMSRTFGSTHQLNLHSTTADERKATIMDLTQGRGVDLAVEATGSLAAFREAPHLIRVGGTYAVIGIGEPDDPVPMEVFRDVVRRNLRMQGTWTSGTRHLRQAVTLVSNELDAFRGLITHRFSLDEANEALHAVEQKIPLKAVIIPS